MLALNTLCFITDYFIVISFNPPQKFVRQAAHLDIYIVYKQLFTICFLYSFPVDIPCRGKTHEV